MTRDTSVDLTMPQPIRSAAASSIQDTDPAWRHRTVWSVIAAHARARPDGEYLVHEDDRGRATRLTFGALAARVRTLSEGLARLGVRRGDRVAIWMTNRPEFLETYFATMRLGAILVPVNTYLRPEEIAYILRKSGARYLVLLDRFRRIDFAAALAAIAPEWPSSTPGRLSSPALPDLRSVVLLGEPVAGAFDFHGIAAPEGGTALADRLEHAASPDDVGLITFTSGSTGFPKGVRLQQWGLVTNALLHGRRLGITDADRWFSQMPLFHAGGNVWGVMTMLTAGGTLVMGETSDALQATRLIERERCTFYFGAPAMQHDILDSLQAHPADLSSIRIASHRVDERLGRELWEPFGVRRFSRAFGLTETYGPTTTVLQEGPVAPGDIQVLGFPLDGAEARVIDPASGAELPPGSTGELVLRGMIMTGYHESPELTAAAVDAEGWLHTGDLGFRDDRGWLRFVGRLKLMLKVGGENVAIEEVEQTIGAFPGVAEVCVIGVPDVRLDEVPRAYVATRGEPLDLAALEAYLAGRLARFKVPRSYVIMDTLPQTGSAKVDRAALARLGREPAQG